MNEPEVNDPYRWAGIQRRPAAIREARPKHHHPPPARTVRTSIDLLTQHPLPDAT